MKFTMLSNEFYTYRDSYTQEINSSHEFCFLIELDLKYICIKNNIINIFIIIIIIDLFSFSILFKFIFLIHFIIINKYHFHIN